MRIPAFVFTLLLCSPAAAFTAQNGMAVEATGEGTFSVRWSGKSAPIDFWCAAGDYGIRRLGLASSAMIYRASEPPRRSGEGVVFTLDPAAAATRTGLAFHWPPGAAVSAGFAQSFCEGR